ncbi:ATP-binding protein [Saccharopolyspora rhizosphaerae]|uniref:histidine kinase n=1 Tax=Saccharopolyspora rhizosphaerae TaxID=2492662 RepID=A0A426JWR6_9PSEU|nr:ATP-binding protein [Saccharopolyspora rhizosphaerae]RRO17618.1 ATP-binding protein [Saccharopolyspora rhizosphaerae]
MSESPLPATYTDRAPEAPPHNDLRAKLQRLVVVSLAVTALLGTATAVVLAFVPPPGLRYTALAVGIVACIAVVVVGYVRVNALAEEVDDRIHESGREAQAKLQESLHHAHQWIESLRATVAQGTRELPQLVEQIQAGQQPAPKWPTGEPVTGNPYELLAHELRQAQMAVEFALVRMQSEPSQQSTVEPSVAVFANLARRVQSLAHRAIQRLDELEQQVEDPDLLKGLFAVDHLVTGVRRQAESLAVLGGSMPRRQWSKPVAMYTVLRSAVAEVEHYARVKVIPPVDGTLHGHAVADVIHLIAELVENATAFSEPDTQVTINSQVVTAGLAIDIRDRGLGIDQRSRVTLNGLLNNPDEVDRDAQLRDGRIGLYVVAQLANRHHIGVELENNMYGGTDAHVVIPNNLLGETDVEPDVSAEQSSSSVLSTVEPGSGGHDSRTAMMPAPPTFNNGHHTGQQPAYSTGPQPAVHEERPAQQLPQRGRHSGIANSAPPAASGPSGADNAERPALPRRDRTRSYLVPQLADSSPTPEEKPQGGPSPSLYASFRSGVEGGTSDDRPGQG